LGLWNFNFQLAKGAVVYRRKEKKRKEKAMGEKREI
jgi:hypothetical protein